MKRLHSCAAKAWLLFFLSLATRSDPSRAWADGPPEAPKGTVVAVGGGRMPEAVWAEFLSRAGGARARVVVIPTASASAEGKDAERTFLESWRKKGVASAVLLHAATPDQARKPDFVKPLAEASAVWIGGGDQNRLTAAYLGTPVIGELKKVLERGGVVGGTSAGAAVLSQLMIAGGNPDARVAEGFGLLPDVVIDQHFLKRDRVNRLLGVVNRRPELAGVGIDEGTAAVFQGAELKVVGDSYVTICLGATKHHPVSLTVLPPGGRTDLAALRLRARDRLKPAAPALKP